MKILHKKLLRWGFTLLEVLIVLVIIATLAGLAIPSYASSVERMRTLEAIQSLMAIRGSMNRYQVENGDFSGATLTLFSTNLDFQPNYNAPGNVRIFNYSFSAGPTPLTYTARARRIPDAGCGSPYSVFIDQNGVITHS